MEYNPSVLVLLQFFGWWTIFVASCSAFGLYSIWNRLKVGNQSSKNDFGLKWLSYGVGTWVIGGALILASPWPKECHDALPTTILSTVSIINGMFILFSLPYFEHKHHLLKNFLDQKKLFKIIVGLTALVLWALTIVIAIAFSSENNTFYSEVLNVSINWVSIPDWIFATVTTFCLLLMFKETFRKRGLIEIEWLSSFVLTLTMIVQTLKLVPTRYDLKIYSYLDLNQIGHQAYVARYIGGAIFMALLIMLFFALAYSTIEAESAKKLNDEISKRDLRIIEKEKEIKEIELREKNQHEEIKRLVNINDEVKTRMELKVGRIMEENQEIKNRAKAGREMIVLLNPDDRTVLIEIPNLLNPTIVKFQVATYKHFLEFVYRRLYFEEAELFINKITHAEVDRIAIDIIMSIYPNEYNSRVEAKSKLQDEWKAIRKAIFENAKESGVTEIKGERLKYTRGKVYSSFKNKTSMSSFLKRLEHQKK